MSKSISHSNLSKSKRVTLRARIEVSGLQFDGNLWSFEVATCFTPYTTINEVVDKNQSKFTTFLSLYQYVRDECIYLASLDNINLIIPTYYGR